MGFQEKYGITTRYLTAPSKRRPGLQISPSVKFIVAHDTGNPGSTASQNVSYYQNSRNEMSASAHLFVDDKEIIECIPALTNTPEKAWHVLYGLPTDNALYGYNANDVAIGVEYCYGGRIIADKAYNQFIWLMAFICHKFGLDPRVSIVGHFFLDPKRKTDPVTGLADSRRTYDQMLKDVVLEYEDCTGKPLPALSSSSGKKGTATASVQLNIREGRPSTLAPVKATVAPGTSLRFTAAVSGQSINGNEKWYKDPDGNFFWSGGTA